MRKVRRSFWEIQNRIAELVELLIVCHPQGFRVLLGEVPPPMSKEIHEMMNAGRDKLPDDFVPTMPNLLTEAERIVFDREYFDRSVELAGGWPHIHLVSREYRDSDSRMWSSDGSREVCGECVIASCVKAGVCGSALRAVSEHSDEVPA